jgi:hypothetical protein
MKTAVIHPAYFLNIETMAWAAQCEQVILEVCDNYQKQTYRNRCLIAHSNGSLTLTIPIKHSKTGQRQKMSQVVPEDSFTWQRDHWRSIQTAYRTSPYFEFYEDDLASLFKDAPKSLLQLNLDIFYILSELIGIDATISKTVQYELIPETTDARFLINCKRKPKVHFAPYTQVFGNLHGFLPNISVLDLLFNEGPNSISYLQNIKLENYSQ